MTTLLVPTSAEEADAMLAGAGARPGDASRATRASGAGSAGAEHGAEQGAEHGAGAAPVPIAGGTDLLVQRRSGRDLPVMLDLSNLRDAPAAAQVLPGGRVRLSATRPLSEIAAAPATGPLPAVRQAIAVFASAQIRNRATIGGNLATASPSGDLMPPLVAADARILVRSAAGRRAVPVRDFLRGPRRTDLRPGEWIEAVELDRPGGASGFRKLGGRRALAISVVNLAWRWTIRPDGALDDVRLAVGAAAPTVVRCPAAERILTGAAPTRAIAESAAAALAGDLAPIDDLRGSADYRRAAAGGLLVEALLPLSDESSYHREDVV